MFFDVNSAFFRNKIVKPAFHENLYILQKYTKIYRRNTFETENNFYRNIRRIKKYVNLSITNPRREKQ